MSASNPDPEQNLPGWLKALRGKQAEPEDSHQEPAAEQMPEQPAAEDEPEWLAEIRKRHRGEAAHDAEERALTDTQPNPPLHLETRSLEPEPGDAPRLEAESQPEELVPDWLEEDEEEAQLPLEEPLADEAEPESTQAITPAFREDSQDEENLTPAELPSWLQAIRPGAVEFPEEDERSEEMLPEPTIEDSGPLAGLSGVLQAEPEISKVSKAPVFSTRLEVSEAQARHAAVLRDLIESEAKPKEDHAASVRRPARLLNMLMAGALILAGLAPLLTGSQSAPRPEINAFPESAAVFNEIDVLPAGAPVLVVFDVQPAFYGEMQAPLRAVVAHLLEKQARLVIVSTQPGGPALAQRLLQDYFANDPAVLAGDVASLGYLTGGMAAVRSFAADPRAATLSAPAAVAQPWQAASLQAIDNLDDFALILAAVSEGEEGRVWIEQAAPSLARGLLLVTSAQAAPSLRPYLGEEGMPVAGLVSGVSGAAHYDRLRARDEVSQAYWEPFSYELGAAVLVILLGGLYGRLIQTRPEQPKAKVQDGG